MAELGEFTKRAFLNRRIDLLQAEGIFDLTCARFDRAASAALEKMEGRLNSKSNLIYEAFEEVAANLETTLGFVEDELLDDIFSGIVDLLARKFVPLVSNIFRIRSFNYESRTLIHDWD